MHYMKFFEQCIIMLIFFLFTYVLTRGIFWEVPGKYLENESGIWLATLCKLSLNSVFYIKNIKRISTARSVWFVFSYRDVDKYRHASISFLTKMYQFVVKVNNNHKN